MKKIRTFCDICGNEIFIPAGHIKIRYKMIEDEFKDLCKDCYESIYKNIMELKKKKKLGDERDLEKKILETLSQKEARDKYNKMSIEELERELIKNCAHCGSLRCSGQLPEAEGCLLYSVLKEREIRPGNIK